MHLKTPIRAFQTGRTYTKEGQRIAWAVTYVFDDGWSEVSFYDLDRFIEGRSVLPKAPEQVTDADVLFLYDHNAYRGYIENPDLKLALRDAAEAVPALSQEACCLELPRKDTVMLTTTHSLALAWHIEVDPGQEAPHCLAGGLVCAELALIEAVDQVDYRAQCVIALCPASAGSTRGGVN